MMNFNFYDTHKYDAAERQEKTKRRLLIEKNNQKNHGKETRRRR